jgi:uncharacterized protein
LLFADTSYLIALLDRRDALHGAARRAAGQIGRRLVVTTEFVIAEWFNTFSHPGAESRDAVIDAYRRIVASSAVEVVGHSSLLFRAAVTRFTARRDKAWSLTDCASFVVMENRGIDEALTHDRHFEQAGFRALLR